MTPVDLLYGVSELLLRPLSLACPPSNTTHLLEEFHSHYRPACQLRLPWFAHLSLNIIHPQESGDPT
ncbi:hypothetical protein ATANTOWER_015238 [Ataeniobius toweri]|uniref:Uncharacterized protein n=1 Tax=Ataeniobius toweri TaxID=208326 RepID=A0ABU7CH82_9TELE|nr:hypothetical protein [Ataeniobius toweri]